MLLHCASICWAVLRPNQFVRLLNNTLTLVLPKRLKKISIEKQYFILNTILYQRLSIYFNINGSNQFILCVIYKYIHKSFLTYLKPRGRGAIPTLVHTYLFSHLKGFQFVLCGSGILNCQQCRALSDCFSCSYAYVRMTHTQSMSPAQWLSGRKKVGNSYCLQASGRVYASYRTCMSLLSHDHDCQPAHCLPRHLNAMGAHLLHQSI